MKVKDLTLNALMIAFLAVASQITIPIQPVPITLQTLAVMLIGILLTPKNAFLTILGYIILGLIGLPIFSGFSGGPASILLPSFGFILAWLPAASLQSLYLERQEGVGIKELTVSAIINSFLTSLIGIIYMAFILNGYMGQNLSLSALLMLGFVPFIPGDLIKIGLAVFIGRHLYPRIRLN